MSSRFLKNFFIPTLQNELRPYSLRVKTLSVVVLIVLAIEFLLFFYINAVFRVNPFLTADVLSGIQSTIADILPRAISDEINDFRTENNLQPLILNRQLSLAATLKANDMAKRQYFSHLGPSGEEPWVWFNMVGYNYNYAGENLAIDFSDTHDLVSAWEKSPSHRENLLGLDYTETGIGLANGQYEGKNTVFVVQFFAKPQPLAVKPARAEVPAEVSPMPSPEQAVTATPAEPATVASSTPEVEVSGTSSERAAVTVDDLPAAVPPAMSVFERVLISPRYFVQNAMIALILYVLAVLLIPMVIAFSRLYPLTIRRRLWETRILFQRAINMALSVIGFSVMILIVNLILLGAKVV